MTNFLVIDETDADNVFINNISCDGPIHFVLCKYLAENHGGKFTKDDVYRQFSSGKLKMVRCKSVRIIENPEDVCSVIKQKAKGKGR